MASAPLPEPATVRVWDPLLRLFHWTLIVAFAIGWISGEAYYDAHVVAGYTLLGLLAFRLFWGFVGGRHARFAAFAYGPRAVLTYLRALAAGHPPRYLGHNPAGSAMIWLLLLGLLATGVSGVALDAAENFSGPLKDWRLFRYTDLIEEIHELATYSVGLLAVLHVAGVVASSHLHRENLVRAMITGRKPALPAAEDAETPESAA